MYEQIKIYNIINVHKNTNKEIVNISINNILALMGRVISSQSHKTCVVNNTEGSSLAAATTFRKVKRT